MASSTASTVLDDGAEKCSYSDCKTLTTKRFQCIVGHKAWMCSSCHRDRPVCPLALQGGSLCGAKEDNYKVDTDLEDLDSRPDSSVLLEEPFAELHEKMAREKYEEVLSEVNRLKANLLLVEREALWALYNMACKTSGHEKRDALKRVQNVTRMSKKELFFNFPNQSREAFLRDQFPKYSDLLYLKAKTRYWSLQAREAEFPEEEFPQGFEIQTAVTHGRAWNEAEIS